MREHPPTATAAHIKTRKSTQIGGVLDEAVIGRNSSIKREAGKAGREVCRRDHLTAALIGIVMRDVRPLADLPNLRKMRDVRVFPLTR